jgi:hypothetical protein
LEHLLQKSINIFTEICYTFSTGIFFRKEVVFMSMIKEEAKKIIDKMPEQATWDDIMYQFYVKKKIELSIKAAETGKILSHEDVKKRVLMK